MYAYMTSSFYKNILGLKPKYHAANAEKVQKDKSLTTKIMETIQNSLNSLLGKYLMVRVSMVAPSMIMWRLWSVKES